MINLNAEQEKFLSDIIFDLNDAIMTGVFTVSNLSEPTYLIHKEVARVLLRMETKIDYETNN